MNIADVPQWLLAAGGLAGVSGAVISAVQARATRHRINAESDKLSAEADHVLTQRASAVNAMALGLLDPMERRIRELTFEVEHLRTQINALTDRLELAQHLLTLNGIALPPWPIDPQAT